MDESQNPTKPPDIADLIAFVEEVVAAWKEIGRQNFVARPDADPDAFERQWPQLQASRSWPHKLGTLSVAGATYPG
jgi:hypothetical protein